MRKQDCEHLERIRRSREGLDVEQQGHVTSCSICSDARVVDHGLRALVRSIEWNPLPDAGIIWLRARLVRLQKATDRVNRPFDLAQKFSWAVLSAAWVILIASQMPGILTWIGRFEAEQLVLGGLSALPITTRFVWLFAGLSAMTFTVLFHRILDID